MKKTQLNEYRQKETAVIQETLRDLSAKLTAAYLTRSAGKLKNTAMIKTLKNEIAQLKTIIREKELTESKS